VQRLNLAFHKICWQRQDEWEITPKKFWQIIKYCQDNHINFMVYFDDGDELNDIEDKLKAIKEKVILAITIDKVGKKGYLSWKEIERMYRNGYKIASHGVNHTSLCWFDENGQILENPKGGIYERSKRGKKLLSENQVRYQLIESYKAFQNHGVLIDEFVFPYGLYSKQTVEIIRKAKLYKRCVTCDMGIDVGKFLVPRLLINNNTDNIKNIKCLTKNIIW